MQLLIPQEDLINYKSRQLVPLRCQHCGKTFYKTKHYIQTKSKTIPITCCSIQCANKSRLQSIPMVSCINCGVKFQKLITNIRRSCNHFCSKKCAAIRNGKIRRKPAKHKEYKRYSIKCITNCTMCNKQILKPKHACIGSNNLFCNKSCRMKFFNINTKTRQSRSKLEIYLESQLTMLYPSDIFIFNDRKTIGYELDIYAPKLQLAIEINGIAHYQPIYGIKEYERRSSIDREKIQKCKDHNITLITIDVSGERNFNISVGEKYLTQIKEVVAGVRF